ncbi:VOC family protein [Saccharomonospora sp. NPDC046836]|uniref:VOC family protein n=1 Tax=Saccharomonospora sp. NPDC046836 TaxID=3156921 RepID=UPI0033ED49E5
MSIAIGRLFHIIHMTNDVTALEAWYDDVFSVREFMPHNYSRFEQRDASLVVLGDCVIEPLAPAFRVPGWETMPLGRFYQRFGSHWHSIAWYTDDAGEIWQRCTDAGVRVLTGGGAWAGTRPGADGIIMTHPKDTITQLQFAGPRDTVQGRDPRFAPDWDPDWWVDNHPTATPGLAYTTVLTRDRERAEKIYAGVLGGTVLHKGSSTLTGTHDTYVLVGDTVVQLSTPNTDGTIAARDMAANNEIHHAAAFRVGGLDATEAYLTSKGITTLARDERTLLTDPATTHGVPFRWTTWDVPGSPRAEP